MKQMLDLYNKTRDKMTKITAYETACNCTQTKSMLTCKSSVHKD